MLSDFYYREDLNELHHKNKTVSECFNSLISLEEIKPNVTINYD